LRAGARFESFGCWLDSRRPEGLLGSIWAGESDEKSLRRLKTRLSARNAIEGDLPIKRRDARLGAYLARGAESGTALEEGNPEGMFGLSGTMTRERIPTHNVVGSRPRASSYCDHSYVLPLPHQNSSAELSSVGEFSGHSPSVPHPMTEIAVLKHLYRAIAMFPPSAKHVSPRALGLQSSPMIASGERPTSSFKKARSRGSIRAATYLQPVLSKSLDPVGMSLRGVCVKNVWVDWGKRHSLCSTGWVRDGTTSTPQEVAELSEARPE